MSKPGKVSSESFPGASNGGGHGSRTPSVAGSGLKPPSPAPTKGASPLVRSPRRGRTPFGTPGRGFSNSAEEVWWRAPNTTVVDQYPALRDSRGCAGRLTLTDARGTATNTCSPIPLPHHPPLPRRDSVRISPQAALRYAEKLVLLSPQDQAARQLLKQLPGH